MQGIKFFSAATVLGAAGGSVLCLIAWLFLSFISWELVEINWPLVRSLIALGIGWAWLELFLDWVNS